MKEHVFDVLTEDYKPVRVSCNFNISNMEFKYLKKDICWFWKTQLNGNKKQEKPGPEEKVLELNSREKKQYKNGKFFKETCNKCGKYGHRASDWWGNDNKGNDNRNDNKNNMKSCFNGECNNCGKRSLRVVDCWAKKKEKEDDVNDLCLGATLCG